MLRIKMSTNTLYVISHTFNVYNLQKPHKLWCKTRSHPPTHKLLLYGQLTGSTNNLMMAHLQGRNM